MDPKTIKNTLKQAKEAIKNKEIDTALKLCKAVLKEDRNNYVGLVMLGAALQESDQKEQAPNAYRKAIEVAPDQPLAWQGLAAFYEKDGSNKHAEHLAPVYKHLLLIESDSSKWNDLIKKLQDIITKYTSDELMVDIVAEYKKTNDNNKSEAFRKLILHYLSHTDDIPEKYLNLYEEFFTKSPSDWDSNQRLVYLKLLYNQKKFQEVLSFAENFTNTSEDVQILEWVCKVCCEEFVENRENVIEWCKKLPKFFTELLEASKDNVFALMAQGTYHMSQKAYLEARECLQNCVSASPGQFHAAVLLAETHACLLCRDQALLWVKTAMTLRPDHPVALAVLAKALSLSEREKDWIRSVTLASQVLKDNHSPLAAEASCEAHLRLRQWSELGAAVARLTHVPQLAALYRILS